MSPASVGVDELRVVFGPTLAADDPKLQIIKANKRTEIESVAIVFRVNQGNSVVCALTKEGITRVGKTSGQQDDFSDGRKRLSTKFFRFLSRLCWFVCFNSPLPLGEPRVGTASVSERIM